jgi:MFS family permease
MVEADPDPRQKSARNIYVFGFTSLFNDTASEMAYWVLPAFLASIGAGPAQLGVIEGIAESVASLVQLFSGYLADRISRRKPIVVAGYFVANLVKPLLALVTSWRQVLAIRFADRFSKGIRAAPRDVMVAESSSRLGSAYGLIQAMDSAGAVLGPLAALFLLPLYGLRGVFWAAAVPGFLCFVIALLGIKEVPKADAAALAPPATREPPAGELGGWRTLAILPGAFYYVLLAVTLFSLGNSSDMFLVLRAQSIAIPVSRAPLLGLVFNITFTMFSWPAGDLSDRFSRRAIAAGGYLVFAAVYFVFALAPSATAIWIAMACYGMFYALTNAVLKALVVETVAQEVRGRALGVYAAVTSVATLAASLITGGLWKHYGPRVPFYASAAIAALAAGLLLGSSAVRGSAD